MPLSCISVLSDNFERFHFKLIVEQKNSIKNSKNITNFLKNEPSFIFNLICIQFVHKFNFCWIQKTFFLLCDIGLRWVKTFFFARKSLFEVFWKIKPIAKKANLDVCSTFFHLIFHLHFPFNNLSEFSSFLNKKMERLVAINHDSLCCILSIASV